MIVLTFELYVCKESIRVLTVAIGLRMSLEDPTYFYSCKYKYILSGETM